MTEEMKDFSMEEKLLLEEYKLGQNAYYRSESEYSSRENFFIVAEGIIISAAVQALIRKLYWVAILISLFGIMLSAVWFFLQARSFGYSRARGDRLEEIEMMLAFNKDPNMRVFTFETRCKEIRETGYLFTIDHELEDELNKDGISEKIKEIFAKHGHPLSEKAKKQNKGRIIDKDGTQKETYLIKEKNGLLKVFVEPKIKHRYEKISTWWLRKSIPLIFTILWIFLSLFSLFLCCQ